MFSVDKVANRWAITLRISMVNSTRKKGGLLHPPLSATTIILIRQSPVGRAL